MDDKILGELALAIREQTEFLKASIGAKAEGKKTVAYTQTAPLLFGAGGIFSTPGVEPDVITAHVRPQGLIEKLSRFPSVMEQPQFASITGFTGAIGGEPAYPCSNAPSGYMKGCNLTAAFGRVARATNTIEFDKVMLQLHRGVSTDLLLHGSVLGLGDLDPGSLNESQILSIITMAEMVQAGVQVERWLNVMTWQGTPANNNVGGGYAEFPGLDLQIATGQRDANTGTLCPALDSDVKDFDYAPVCGTARSIVEYLGMLEWYLRWNADSMGLSPVDWVLAMRPGLWFELTACWPCQYNTNRCATAVIGAASNVTVLGDQMVAERDRMRRSMTIDINGNTYPVVVDTGIFEHNNINNARLRAGQYASSIYMIPLAITGGFKTTYMEHVDYTKGARDIALLRGKEVFWTDKGMYSWALEQIKWCYELTVKIEPRIVLRTPQLAGRIDHVMYEPLEHLREPAPDSPYFADGGVSIRGTPRVYTPWSR